MRWKSSRRTNESLLNHNLVEFLLANLWKLEEVLELFVAQASMERRIQVLEPRPVLEEIGDAETLRRSSDDHVACQVKRRMSEEKRGGRGKVGEE